MLNDDDAVDVDAVVDDNEAEAEIEPSDDDDTARGDGGRCDIDDALLPLGGEPDTLACRADFDDDEDESLRFLRDPFFS